MNTNCDQELMLWDAVQSYISGVNISAIIP